ncbi:MAG: peptidase S41, partial [Duncaniella sp.]|nr:peptidase S41 [Duncaniella sp.]
HRLPLARVGGAVKGGGSGMPYSSELPCGWVVRFSACSMLDAAGESTEAGIPPTPGYEADMDPEAALHGHDTLLDTCVERLMADFQ